jgi:endonuclease/exonuclease/phosphatase (EEP) superfamily protein YafD
MQAETPDGPLWVASLHLHWPFPFQQPEQVNHLLPILEALEGPVLLGGDFNMVPWSHAVDALAQATTTQMSGYAGGTFAPSYHRKGQNLFAWMPHLPIDHILVPKDGAPIALQRRERFGSDHHGLLASFVLHP